MLRPILAEAPSEESAQYVQIPYLKNRKARVLCSNHGYRLLPGARHVFSIYARIYGEVK